MIRTTFKKASIIIAGMIAFSCIVVAATANFSGNSTSTEIDFSKITEVATADIHLSGVGGCQFEVVDEVVIPDSGCTVLVQFSDAPVVGLGAYLEQTDPLDGPGIICIAGRIAEVQASCQSEGLEYPCFVSANAGNSNKPRVDHCYLVGTGKFSNLTVYK